MNIQQLIFNLNDIYYTDVENDSNLYDQMGINQAQCRGTRSVTGAVIAYLAY